MNKKIIHYVQHDPTATGRDRWTCWGKQRECDGHAVVRQPYMSEMQWEAALKKFKAVHS